MVLLIKFANTEKKRGEKTREKKIVSEYTIEPLLQVTNRNVHPLNICMYTCNFKGKRPGVIILNFYLRIN